MVRKQTSSEYMSPFQWFEQFEPLEPFERFEPFEPLEPLEPFEPFERYMSTSLHRALQDHILTHALYMDRKMNRSITLSSYTS